MSLRLIAARGFVGARCCLGSRHLAGARGRLRSALWIAAYALLVLAPLLVALLSDPLAIERPWQLEFGVGLGCVAFALFALEFALVARVRVASAEFGSDALAAFHRQMGSAALGFALAHALLATPRDLWLSAFDPFGSSLSLRCGALALLAAAVLVGAALLRRALATAYERWRTLHRGLALVVVGAMLAHALAVGGYTRAPALRAVLWAGGAGFGLLLAQQRLARPLHLARRPWELVENRDEGADTRTLVLRPIGHAGLCFEPGQFAWLISGRSPWSRAEHPLSIASSALPARDGRLEFTIKALGDWSREFVPKLAPGTRLWVDGPYGAFSCDRARATGCVFIAGGIGITPLLSMLRTLRDRGDRRPLVLVYATHDPSRAIRAAELAALARELDLVLVRVYEEPPPAWRGERGYVTADLLRRHLPARRDGWHYYLCGPGPMLSALERELRQLGVRATDVHTERFDLV
jgi:predicted ferric reductase